MGSGVGGAGVTSPFPALERPGIARDFHGRLNRKVANRFLPLQTSFPTVRGVQNSPGREDGGRWGQGRDRSPHGLLQHPRLTTEAVWQVPSLSHRS